MSKLQKLILVYEPEMHDGEMAQLRTTLPVTADTICSAEQEGNKFRLIYEVSPVKKVVREWRNLENKDE